MTREEWLRHAVEEINKEVFSGDLDLLNHEYQIACSKTGGKKQTECIQPYDGEDVKLSDFFPTTILISHSIQDPIEMLSVLTYECIHAFFNIKGTGKPFKRLAEKYYFDEPYKEIHPSAYLREVLYNVYQHLIQTYGPWPGKTVIINPKEKKEGVKNSLAVFCPGCGYELKISRKMWEKYNNALPTCACGCRMAADLEDETEEKTN